MKQFIYWRIFTILSTLNGPVVMTQREKSLMTYVPYPYLWEKSSEKTI